MFVFLCDMHYLNEKLLLLNAKRYILFSLIQRFFPEKKVEQIKLHWNNVVESRLIIIIL